MNPGQQTPFIPLSQRGKEGVWALGRSGSLREHLAR